MAALRPELRAYLDRTCPGARVVPLAGDASTRRFFRVELPDGGRRVVMDYGRAFSGETDDLRMAPVFREAGLRIAAVLDASGEAGCLLLEDLGEQLLESVFSRQALERAVDLAAALAERGTPALARLHGQDGRRLDAQRFRFEMGFYLEHYARGLRCVDPVSAGLRGQLDRLADLAAATPRSVLCHRDYHSRNLMLLGDGALAMVDFQDAQWGPDSYDLASLLRDAYVDVPEDWIEPMIERYLAGLSDPPEPSAFRRRFDRVAAQRMLKALGTFGYQSAVVGTPRYLSSIPRTLDRLRRLLPGLDDFPELHGELECCGLLAPPV